MRSKWSAEIVLLWLATATMEGAWLTLAYVALAWLQRQQHLDLGILAFCLAVALGMSLAHWFRDLPQTRFAIVIITGAISAGIIGALFSGAPTTDFGAFLRTAVLDPGAWLMGVAVLRGAAQGQPGAGYTTERVFALGVPGLVVFWLLATSTELVHSQEFATAGFEASLSFVSAGLLALGLGRLSDLEVDQIDRGARRRWLLLVVGIVGIVLLIGIPLAGVLGVPVASAVLGILGPIATLLIWLFYFMSIPIFWLLDIVGGLVKPANGPISTPQPQATPNANGPPPLFAPPTGAPPDLTWVLIALLVVGTLILLRVIVLLLQRPVVKDQAGAAAETRANEPIALAHLPHISIPRLPARRPVARSAIEAYRLSLVALADGPQGRMAGETPREHAIRISASAIGPDVRRLAADYQLEQLAGARLTATETRRAIERWKRIVRQVGRNR